MTQKTDFFRYVAQTSPAPLGFEPVKAAGIYQMDASGRKYIDLISGISVSNLGHGQPAIIKAIKSQADRYLHSMVYGEHIQSPQVNFAKKLVEHLPPKLEQVYFVNSGSEAIEGAMKLAKRVTGRHQIVAARGGYHGNTHATLSLMDNTYYSQGYRPLVPGITFISPNDTAELNFITHETACVIMETIQGAMGYLVPDIVYMQQLRKRCDEVGALLILDEIQAGLGRSGRLWGFEHMNIEPDILCLAKALGGGMPMGAFISSQKNMTQLTKDPVLGHITTFGGPAICCAAGAAAFDILTKEKLWEKAEQKAEVFRKELIHDQISHISGKGLMMAVNLKNADLIFPMIERCFELGLLTDGFLLNESALRITPPLNITSDEILESCDIILQALNSLTIGNV